MVAAAGFLFFHSSDQPTEWGPVRDVAAAEKTNSQTSKADPFMTSASCKNCHQRFYELWEPSHHGKAMQVFSKKDGTKLTEKKLALLPAFDGLIAANNKLYMATECGTLICYEGK